MALLPHAHRQCASRAGQGRYAIAALYAELTDEATRAAIFDDITAEFARTVVGHPAR